ncbi:MAG: pyruvate dehydrogenase complex dihydrolipoamide acetyltransferase [Rickettsiales bacterium]|jgi:pyruvate dehydrogenase E2 component (dihydrolipoamide acetyltransferase)|nr:pyruvate dehydrogenase complex dihydrolipoamide acetyltransferase [Rickettsiales bacterium]
MPVKILMPALSPTMTEGTLAKWLIGEGDAIHSGDIIAEIETDKATMEVEAVEEGKLGKILVAEGTEGVAVNNVIALLLEEDEDESALEGVDVTVVSSGNDETTQPAVTPEPATNTLADMPATPLSVEGPVYPVERDEKRIIASPLARRMASQAGLDLAGILGSGPNGRIVKSDVEAALLNGDILAVTQTAAIAPTTAEQLPYEPEFEITTLSTMRKTIARRLTESKQHIPHFYLTVDCEVDDLLDLRKTLNAKADGAYKLSVNDLVIKAAAIALRRVPKANASWTDEGVKIYKSVDISVAVAIEGGLITPVVRQADNKGLEMISSEMKELSERARDGKLGPEEYQGGTFSISNLGMYGIKEFSAVINPPQACILAVGAGEQRPVVKNGALAIATIMSCTLSVDHRAVDGAIGAEYLKAFKRLIEEPLSMLL